MLLQQCLPFTVLKRTRIVHKISSRIWKLQQCLPFTVLKQIMSTFNEAVYIVATVLTVYGIETSPLGAVISHQTQASCNSAYRLRY